MTITFISSIKCLRYASIKCLQYAPHCRWYDQAPSSICKGKIRLREIKRLFLGAQLVSGRVLLILELVIPTFYKTVFLKGYYVW